jgi:hypothetical protein
MLRPSPIRLLADIRFRVMSLAHLNESKPALLWISLRRIEASPHSLNVRGRSKVSQRVAPSQRHQKTRYWKARNAQTSSRKPGHIRSCPGRP